MNKRVNPPLPPTPHPLKLAPNLRAAGRPGWHNTKEQAVVFTTSPGASPAGMAFLCCAVGPEGGSESHMYPGPGKRRAAVYSQPAGLEGSTSASPLGALGMLSLEQ